MLNEQLQQLKECRQEIEVANKALQMAKGRESLIKENIIDAMKAEQLESARYEDYTATVAHRKTLKVVDEKKVVEYLKANKLTDYLSERPNELFEGFRKSAEKKELVIEGMAMSEVEYLSVRIKSTKKEEE